MRSNNNLEKKATQQIDRKTLKKLDEALIFVEDPHFVEKRVSLEEDTKIKSKFNTGKNRLEMWLDSTVGTIRNPATMEVLPTTKTHYSFLQQISPHQRLTEHSKRVNDLIKLVQPSASNVPFMSIASYPKSFAVTHKAYWRIRHYVREEIWKYIRKYLELNFIEHILFTSSVDECKEIIKQMIDFISKSNDAVLNKTDDVNCYKSVGSGICEHLTPYIEANWPTTFNDQLIFLRLIIIQHLHMPVVYKMALESYPGSDKSELDWFLTQVTIWNNTYTKQTRSSMVPGMIINPHHMYYLFVRTWLYRKPTRITPPTDQESKKLAVLLNQWIFLFWDNFDGKGILPIDPYAHPQFLHDYNPLMFQAQQESDAMSKEFDNIDWVKIANQISSNNSRSMFGSMPSPSPSVSSAHSFNPATNASGSSFLFNNDSPLTRSTSGTNTNTNLTTSNSNLSIASFDLEDIL